LIVGFCGETDEQFANTFEMVKDVKFDKVHSAAYSNRQGTIASRKMIDDVEEDIKKERLRIINAEQEKIVASINSDLKGKTQEVLVEGRKKGKWFGRNRNDKLVFFDSDDVNAGEMINVKIKETSPWYLEGSINNGI
jgi:tRNA-2-methylthio-N6-dimethylallyladenosine synthase